MKTLENLNLHTIYTIEEEWESTSHNCLNLKGLVQWEGIILEKVTALKHYEVIPSINEIMGHAARNLGIKDHFNLTTIKIAYTLT